MDKIWKDAAHILGWKWSAAHDGYINERERKGPTWADYIVASDAEEACHIEGIDRLQKALNVIQEANCL